jgi:hypothetical protein
MNPQSSADWVRAACAVAILLPQAGCASGAASTAFKTAAIAQPGAVGFGTGVTISSGRWFTVGGEAVVSAAGSDDKGPSAKSEGDSTWRVRGGVLELCQWANDGRQDCRYAAYEGMPSIGSPFFTFLPAIIEPGNLAHGAHRATATLPYLDDKAIWVTDATYAGFVFLCVEDHDVPVCRWAPFAAGRILGSVVVDHGGRGSPVVWAQAVGVGAPLGFGLSALVDKGIYRCEAVGGHPQCKKAKEIEQ